MSGTPNWFRCPLGKYLLGIYYDVGPRDSKENKVLTVMAFRVEKHRRSCDQLITIVIRAPTGEIKMPRAYNGTWPASDWRQIGKRKSNILPNSTLPILSMSFPCKVKPNNLFLGFVLFFFIEHMIFTPLLSGFHRRRNIYKHFKPLKKSQEGILDLSFCLFTCFFPEKIRFIWLAKLVKGWHPLGPFTAGRPMHCNKLWVHHSPLTLTGPWALEAWALLGFPGSFC